MNTLFDLPHSRTKDPHTSKEAEAKVNIPKQARMVYAAFPRHAPCTMKELAQLADIDYYVCQRRISDIHNAGGANRREIGTKDGKPLFETRDGAAVWYRGNR
jgi:hypothetical protein